jgi:hypothetical protein
VLENKYKLTTFINVQKTFNPTEAFLMENSCERAKARASTVDKFLDAFNWKLFVGK